MSHASLGLVTLGALTLLSVGCGSAPTSDPPAPPTVSSPTPSPTTETPASVDGPRTNSAERANDPQIEPEKPVRPTGIVHQVAISDAGFEPQSVTLGLGDSVDFVWSVGRHSATSGFSCHFDGVFQSGPRSSPATYRVTFLRPGFFPFFSEDDCERMTGILLVKGE